MTDLYYLIPIGVLAGTNAYVAWRWGQADRARLRLRTKQLWYDEQFHLLCSRWENCDRALLAANAALDAQATKRSANVAKGNHTRALKAKTLRDATTAQLAGEVQAKARELRVAA